ncbi:GNAT family N-acetyltransferase [Nocardia rhamnosiphila]|uniref:GNAT family N-acetyltransferase n=1 Tax=Nocardia rhamnosiphila TaxID=426716 RepID=UPI003794ECDF
MALPEIELTEYTSSDLPMLRQWWEDEDVLKYVHDLDHQMRPGRPGSKVGSGKYLARPLLRYMVRDAAGVAVGFVSVQVTGSWTEREDDPVMPPFHGGVNIVIDPLRQEKGLGSAALKAVFDHPELADLVTLGGSVDVRNQESLGMLRKLGYVQSGPRGEGHGSLHNSRPGSAGFVRYLRPRLNG